MTLTDHLDRVQFQLERLRQSLLLESLWPKAFVKGTRCKSQAIVTYDMRKSVFRLTNPAGDEKQFYFFEVPWSLIESVMLEEKHNQHTRGSWEMVKKRSQEVEKLMHNPNWVVAPREF